MLGSENTEKKNTKNPLLRFKDSKKKKGYQDKNLHVLSIIESSKYKRWNY